MSLLQKIKSFFSFSTNSTNTSKGGLSRRGFFGATTAVVTGTLLPGFSKAPVPVARKVVLPVARKVVFPTFELYSSPSISLLSIKQRRFDMIDRSYPVSEESEFNKGTFKQLKISRNKAA